MQDASERTEAQKGEKEQEKDFWAYSWGGWEIEGEEMDRSLSDSAMVSKDSYCLFQL